MHERFLVAVMALVMGLSFGVAALAQADESFSTLDHSKILGGRETDIGKWPWTVALVHGRMENASRGHFCAGALIADRWALTAAHCLTDRAGNLRFKAGELHVVIGRTDLNSSAGDRIPVSGFVVHPRWNTNTLDSDLALLHLERAPAEGTTWARIAMVPGGDPAGLTRPGTPAWVVGWGALGPDGPRPTKLHEAQLPLVSQVDLIRAYPPPFYSITDNMIGAGPGDGSVDTCHGDSGGPMMVHDQGNNFVLAGVTSWGLQCGTPDIYGVYTRVDNYCNWVKGVTGVGDCGSGGGGGGGGGCTVSAGQGLGGEWLLLAALLAWMALRKVRQSAQATGRRTSLRALF